MPDRPAGAFAAYGRIFKALHLLQVIHVEAYRRMIGAQLNVGESGHSLARRVFFGDLRLEACTDACASCVRSPSSMLSRGSRAW
ncbi:Tn3 family transposase [Nonomuraea diastatica]|uniref:Tn3 transposase DDE domain-containing protein n=1 Tax=Nonomuraea diastatica TaxID=1848329 RepID=A0A4R4WNJ6_9ACTN|nr:Tn3 family transposase [Nonomuraea diastatica]TDD19387.1 hypothetical protein E1294_21210 [Nonomuraea diastatica]